MKFIGFSILIKCLTVFFIILHIRFLNLIRNTDKSDRGTYKWNGGFGPEQACTVHEVIFYFCNLLVSPILKYQ